MSDHIGNPIDIIIDPEGDVILNVCDTLHLRVSSKILSMFSKPFAAMLGSNFAEGTHLNIHQPPTVDLPDDYPESILWICHKLYHHRYHADIWPMPITCLLSIAVVAEKYDLVNTLVGPFNEAMAFYLSGDVQIGGVDNFRLLTAAYIFNSRSLFRDVSRSILLNSEGSGPTLTFIRGEVSRITQRMPALVYVTITDDYAKLRHKFKNRLSHLMHYGKHSGITWNACQCICVGSANDLQMFVAWMDSVQPPFTGHRSLTDALRRDADAHVLSWSLEQLIRPADMMTEPETLDSVSFAFQLIKLIDKTISDVEGLCLDCMNLAGTEETKCELCKSRQR